MGSERQRIAAATAVYEAIENARGSTENGGQSLPSSPVRREEAPVQPSRTTAAPVPAPAAVQPASQFRDVAVPRAAEAAVQPSRTPVASVPAPAAVQPASQFRDVAATGAAEAAVSSRREAEAPSPQADECQEGSSLFIMLPTAGTANLLSGHLMSIGRRSGSQLTAGSGSE